MVIHPPKLIIFTTSPRLKIDTFLVAVVVISYNKVMDTDTRTAINVASKIPRLPYELILIIINLSNSATLQKFKNNPLFGKDTQRELSKRTLYRHDILHNKDFCVIRNQLAHRRYMRSGRKYESVSDLITLNPRLSLLHNIITLDDIKTITYFFPEIKYIDLKWCNNVNDNWINAIASGCPNLIDFELQRIQPNTDFITDDSIINLAQNCKQLESIYLSECAKITDDSIIAIVKHCHNIDTIIIPHCYNITDNSLKAIGKNAKNLIQLDIAECYNITDDGIIAIAEGCPMLEYLTLSELSLYGRPNYNYPQHITDNGIFAIANNCHNLQHIDLRLSYISDECISYLLQLNLQVSVFRTLFMSIKQSELSFSTNITTSQINVAMPLCKNICKMDFNGCKMITDEHIKTIVKYSPELYDINLNSCNLITDDSINNIVIYCDELHFIDINRCHKITDAGIISLVMSCPELETIGINHCPKISAHLKNLIGEQMVVI